MPGYTTPAPAPAAEISLQLFRPYAAHESAGKITKDKAHKTRNDHGPLATLTGVEFEFGF